MAVNNHKTELKGKDKFLASLSNFLVKRKVFLLILLAAAAVIIAAVAVIDSVTERKANLAAESVELVQEKYADWLEADEADKEALEAEILEKIDAITDQYHSTFAAQRAVYIKGNIEFQKENWTAASENFLESADMNKDSYLAPISMMLAGSAFENGGSYEEALGVYNDIYADYDKIFPDVPRVMLSIGRLNEQTGDEAAAIDAYNELIDNYPGSGWASFARTRLIQIEE